MTTIHITGLVKPTKLRLVSAFYLLTAGMVNNQLAFGETIRYCYQGITLYTGLSKIRLGMLLCEAAHLGYLETDQQSMADLARTTLRRLKKIEARLTQASITIKYLS